MKELMVKLHPNSSSIVAFNNVFDCGTLAFKTENKEKNKHYSTADIDLFNKYAHEFPCLKNSAVELPEVQKFRQSLIDNDSDDNASKELALDCILELLFGGDYQITWKDIFDVFNRDDQEAFLRIMSLHANLAS